MYVVLLLLLLLLLYVCQRESWSSPDADMIILTFRNKGKFAGTIKVNPGIGTDHSPFFKDIIRTPECTDIFAVIPPGVKSIELVAVDKNHFNNCFYNKELHIPEDQRSRPCFKDMIYKPVQTIFSSPGIAFKQINLPAGSLLRYKI